jgi:1-acyl-sn-glycerol-3-phosphate acyltransferase
VLYAALKPPAAFLMRCLFGLRGRGVEHVPASGPVLITANHSSLLDPPLVGGVQERELVFMAKAELFDIPLFGGFIRRLNAQPVRREGGDAAALRAALRVLEEGRALLIFPEGTRGEEGVLRPGKPGAGMLAVLSGAPIVPAYISGSGRAWPRGRRLPRPASITVYFGPPFHAGRVQGAGRKEQYEAASRAMMAAIAQVRDRAIGAPVPGGRIRDREVGAVGRAGVGPGSAPKFIDGRNGRHGEG